MRSNHETSFFLFLWLLESFHFSCYTIAFRRRHTGQSALLTHRVPSECPRSCLRLPQWACRILVQGQTPQRTTWSPAAKAKHTRFTTRKSRTIISIAHFYIFSLHLPAALKSMFLHLWPCTDTCHMFRSFLLLKGCSAPYIERCTNHRWEQCSLHPRTAFCWWTLKDWVFNALLAGTFMAVVACKRHWIINLLCALKCHNTGILLFAACTLFISRRSYWRRNVRRETLAVFRKTSEGGEGAGLRQCVSGV